MKTALLTGILFALIAAILYFSSPAHTEGEHPAQRGDDPQCQLTCLKDHSDKMATLAQSLSQTGDKQTYQNQVDHEETRYAHCLTNCRQVIPIK